MTEYCENCHGFRPFTVNGIGMHVCVSCKQDITPEQKDTEELDEWIHEHVFGFKLVLRKVMYDEVSRSWEKDGSSECVRDYTTNPSDAMSVLEKCVDRASVAISNGDDGWTVQHRSHCPNYATGTAPTLPLSICMFARKVFSAS